MKLWDYFTYRSRCHSHSFGRLGDSATSEEFNILLGDYNSLAAVVFFWEAETFHAGSDWKVFDILLGQPISFPLLLLRYSVCLSFGMFLPQMLSIHGRNNIDWLTISSPAVAQALALSCISRTCTVRFKIFFKVSSGTLSTASGLFRMYSINKEYRFSTLTSLSC